jgi:2-polyprenyl-6-hydroxyphenyl methylase/3-demethylubiquinone-9 3-methyltransferase
VQNTASKSTRVRPVNNEIYSTLGARWYDADDDPVALLRAESRLRNPWVARHVEGAFGDRRCAVLDIGCGAGFLSNHLAALGHTVTGLDASSESLDVAARHDATGTVRYDHGDALALPYADGAFDIVCAMDFLEHVEDPGRVIGEAARVLAPGGLFFFHTFNRNWLSWLVIIKGVEWFVKNTPADMHVLHLFLRPDEVSGMCRAHGLETVEQVGSRPIFGRSFWGMLATGRVPPDFGFTFTRSTRLAYTGVARKANGGLAR